MIEQTYKLTRTGEKTVERVLLDENIAYVHMVLPRNEGPPVHNTDSNVYMTVVRGTLSIALGGEAMHQYEAGTLLKIPNATKMNLKNLHAAPLELIIVKAPAPLSS
ncbi:MAG: cupin domain-containing protein [Treponema sp.]|nr:cupin domain-containing protein [Treponema sp.]